MSRLTLVPIRWPKLLSALPAISPPWSWRGPRPLAADALPDDLRRDIGLLDGRPGRRRQADRATGA